MKASVAESFTYIKEARQRDRGNRKKQEVVEEEEEGEVYMGVIHQRESKVEKCEHTTANLSQGSTTGSYKLEPPLNTMLAQYHAGDLDNREAYSLTAEDQGGRGAVPQADTAGTLDMRKSSPTSKAPNLLLKTSPKEKWHKAVVKRTHRLHQS